MGMCVVLKNEGMVFDHVTSPLPVVVGVGVFRSLFSRWKNLSTSADGKSERICHLTWSSLLIETSHVWGH